MTKKKTSKLIAEEEKNIYDLQAELCSALAHPVRLHILDILGTGEKNCSELLEILKIPKSNLTQHLSVLKNSGILNARKEGLYQYVSLALPKVKDACSLVRGMLLEKISLKEQKNQELIKELRNQKRASL